MFVTKQLWGDFSLDFNTHHAHEQNYVYIKTLHKHKGERGWQKMWQISS